MRDLKQAVMDEILSQHTANLLLELREAPQQVVKDVHETAKQKISIGATDLLSRSLDNIQRQLLNQSYNLVLKVFEISLLEDGQNDANMLDNFRAATIVLHILAFIKH